MTTALSMQAIPTIRSTDPVEVQAALKNLRPDLVQRGVKHMWLFGSRAKQTAKPGSDWDVLVEFTKPPGLDDFMGLKFWLEEQLGGPVDLVSWAACKPRFLAAINHELLDVA